MYWGQEMSLKHGLQSINPNSIKSSLEAYDIKIKALDDVDILENEQIAQILNYRGLNEIVVQITDYALLEYDVEQALNIGLGASIAVGLIIEIAEIAELPPLNG
jgi:hypothetical protein